MEKRHAVRSFTDGRIEGEIKDALDKEVAACNSEGGLRIQLVTDEPEAFGGFMSRHSDFSNVRNYIALVGADNTESREKLGYYGERLVILAQRLGLNSCWVALTFSKRESKVEVGPGEALVCAIALGYGTTQGESHPIKRPDEVSKCGTGVPEWFAKGVECALLAPTALMKQNFMFEYRDRKVYATSKGICAPVNLGIVKYHFEVGAGKDNVVWG
ncbi:nitroreductase family protein [Methanomethylophilus alvi]|uniref:nitroreductase family protein n=1 Tax=Methanomethylophilus alvi TaxID=1291540 RepID=UPI0037DD6798